MYIKGFLKLGMKEYNVIMKGPLILQFLAWGKDACSLCHIYCEHAH